MESEGTFCPNIRKINMIHEFVLDDCHVCSYPRGRGQYGLIFGLEGEAEWYFLNGERCGCSAGQLLLLSPGAAYRIVTGGSFRHVTVNFQLNGEAFPFEGKEGIYLRHTPPQSGRYSTLLREAAELWRRKNAGYEARAMAYLYELLSMIEADRGSTRESQLSYRRLLRAKEILDRELDRPVPVAELARVSNMSPTHFRREWQRVFGQTAMQYRDQVKLTLAEEYLRSGYYSVSEVAARCGFEDVSYFVRFYKRHKGITPGDCKRQRSDW